MIPALISQVKGLAAFDDGDEVRFINTARIKEIFRDEGGYYSKALSEAPDLESLEVQDLDGLRKHLLLRSNREELLHAALILLDSSWSRQLRGLAGRILHEQHNPEDWEWVEGVLCSAPLPQTADIATAGRLCPMHKQFFSEVAAAQAEIATLTTAWHTLSERWFEHETRDQLHAKIVRRGAFRHLLRGGDGLSGNPFARALSAGCSNLRQDDPGPGKALLERVASPSAPFESGIWAVSSWRTACLASEWPIAEARLACRGADLLSKSTAFDIPLANDSVEARLRAYYESWNWVRNHSALAEAVDSIYSITGEAGSSRAYLIQVKSNLSENRNVDRPDRTWKGIQGELLKKLVFEYFERGTRSDAEADTSVARFAKADRENLLLTEDREGWKTLAEDLQIAFDSLGTGSSNPLRIDSGSRYQEWRHLTAGSSLSQLLQAVSDVMAVYAVDRIFRRKGATVWISYDVDYAYGVDHSLPKSRPYAILLNPQMRQSRIFDGYLAILLALLRKRLVADIQSGIPKSRCGWIHLDELSQSVTNSSVSVESNINALRSDVLSAGFPAETLQQSSNVVRLNPEFAAVADHDFR